MPSRACMTDRPTFPRAPTWPTPPPWRVWRSPTPSSAPTTRSRTRPGPASVWPMGAPTGSSCPSAALQRRAAEQVDGGARLLGVRRAGQVRAARRIVFGGRTAEEAAAGCSVASRTCSRAGDARTLRDAGVPEDVFLAALPELAMTAFQDLSNRTNPRMPLVSEITTLLRSATTETVSMHATTPTREDDRDQGPLQRGARHHP